MDIALKSNISKREESKTFFVCVLLHFRSLMKQSKRKKVNIKAEQCVRDDTEEDVERQFPVNGSD